MEKKNPSDFDSVPWENLPENVKEDLYGVVREWIYNDASSTLVLLFDKIKNIEWATIFPKDLSSIPRQATKLLSKTYLNTDTTVRIADDFLRVYRKKNTSNNASESEEYSEESLSKAILHQFPNFMTEKNPNILRKALKTLRIDRLATILIEAYKFECTRVILCFVISENASSREENCKFQLTHHHRLEIQESSQSSPLIRDRFQFNTVRRCAHLSDLIYKASKYPECFSEQGYKVLYFNKQSKKDNLEPQWALLLLNPPKQNEFNNSNATIPMDNDCQATRLFLVFRGTKSQYDVLADSQFIPTEHLLSQENHHVHSGIYNAMRKTIPRIVQQLEALIHSSKQEFFHLRITGHSLGGGYAQLFFLDLHTSIIASGILKAQCWRSIRVVTFGAPLTLAPSIKISNDDELKQNAQLAQERCLIDELSYHTDNFVNQFDPVPRLLGPSAKVLQKFFTRSTTTTIINSITRYQPIGNLYALVSDCSDNPLIRLLNKEEVEPFLKALPSPLPLYFHLMLKDHLVQNSYHDKLEQIAKSNDLPPIIVT